MEMAVVILILGLLATIVTPIYMNKVKQAKITTARTQILMLEQAANDFNMSVGRFPATLDDLVRKTGDEKWDGPYLKGGLIPKDPWGNNYVYAVPGPNGMDFEIKSLGSDGMTGGTGDAADITNYTPAQ